MDDLTLEQQMFTSSVVASGLSGDRASSSVKLQQVMLRATRMTVLLSMKILK